MEFESANPSVVRSVKQRELLNTWLWARAKPRERALPGLRDYQPDCVAARDISDDIFEID